MEVNEAELEKKILYRLIRIVYFLALLGSIVFVTRHSLGYGPRFFPGIVCNNGDRYVLFFDYISQQYVSETGIHSFKTIVKDGESQRREICTYGATVYELEQRKLAPEESNYTLLTSVFAGGSLEGVATVWIFLTPISYLALNVIREMLLYIIYGRAFSWKRLLKI